MQREKRPKLLFSDIIQQAIKYINHSLKQSNYLIEDHYLWKLRDLCGSFVELIKLFEDSDRIYYPEYRDLVYNHIYDLSLRNILFGNNKGEASDLGYLSNKQRKELYKLVFFTFEEQLNDIIDKSLNTIKEDYEDNRNDLPQTFLSYSYNDKGITFILFLYFLFVPPSRSYLL